MSEMPTKYSNSNILKIKVWKEFIMFWIGLIVGLILGANISLFIYAILLAGKDDYEKWF